MIVTGGCSAEVSQEKAMYDTHRGFTLLFKSFGVSKIFLIDIFV